MRFLTVLSVCVALALARPVPQSRINIDDIENLKLEDLDVPTLDANAGERSNSGDTAGTKVRKTILKLHLTAAS